MLWLWCVKVGFAGGDKGGGGLCVLSWVGGLGASVYVGGGGAFVVCGYGDYWFVLLYMWERSVEGYEVRLRLCVVEEEFQALHWKMLSWLVFVGCVRAYVSVGSGLYALVRENAK